MTSGRGGPINGANNFDLIRLAAATQVVIGHGFRYIAGGESTIAALIEMVPGVPIFFFVSGYLISASYDRSSSLTSYARKRVLRIYPALWLCVVLTVAVLAITGYLADAGPSPVQFGTWVIAQGSFVQFYNPDWSRHYGAGIVNPALWTISVELQFYVAMPALAWLFRRSRIAWGVLFAGLVAFSAFYSLVLHPSEFGGSVLGKLIGVTMLPWVCMFMVGNLTQAYAPQIRRYTDGRAAIWVAIYAALALVGLAIEKTFGVYLSGNSLPIVLFLPLAMMVLAVAYTRPRVSVVLRGNDFSYGLYLLHMPVIGTWLYLGGAQAVWAIPACLGIALAAACISWFGVERRALRHKGRSRAGQVRVADMRPEET